MGREDVVSRSVALLRKWRTSPDALFYVVFLGFVVAAYAISAANPLGPGQDQHYHVLSASITARYWWGDPEVRALYKFINPLDAQTLVYTFLFPFELVFNPISAWKWGFATLYFVGYPLACAVALKLLRKPLWGALLAFPLAYTKSWSQGGFLPFVSTGPFFVLAIAAMHRVLEDGPRPTDSPKTRVRARWTVAIACTLAMLAHAHAYAWLMAVLGALTFVVLGRDLVVGLPRDPLATLKAATLKGLLALVVVLPSLLVFGIWYWRTHMGANAPAHGGGLEPSHDTWATKIATLPANFVHLQADVEWGQAALLAGIVLVLVLLSGSLPGGTMPTAELALVMSLASYFYLPMMVSGQSVAVRHLDFVQWLVPLVVYRFADPRARLRNAVVVSVIAGYSAYRLKFVAENLKGLQKEYEGIYHMAKPCPSSPAELAYVTFGTYSAVWAAPALHQTHESLAALCKWDTPVYDPTIYPHNLIPVRYKGKPPSPVTILQGNQHWYRHPDIWKDFDLVLVRGWTPSPQDLEEVSKVAIRLRVWNEWQLWHKKPKLEGEP